VGTGKEDEDDEDERPASDGTALCFEGHFNVHWHRDARLVPGRVRRASGYSRSASASGRRREEDPQCPDSELEVPGAMARCHKGLRSMPLPLAVTLSDDMAAWCHSGCCQWPVHANRLRVGLPGSGQCTPAGSGLSPRLRLQAPWAGPGGSEACHPPRGGGS
jgi:hypothetical protein